MYIYYCKDIDDAATILTDKLVSVLNAHAPWIVFQQRKHFVPWLTSETVKLMEERDKYKQEAKDMAMAEGTDVSPRQAELWSKYKKVNQCQGCPSNT